jgi:tetratricopeptide (TPR) repeat protein
MAVVAVLALVLGVSVEAVRMRRARSSFLKLATENEQSEKFFRILAKNHLLMAEGLESAARHLGTIQRPVIPFVYPQDEETREPHQSWAEAVRQRTDASRSRAQAKMHQETAEYHAALKQKYLAAAARPWQSIEPDAPPPDPTRQGSYWHDRGDHQRTVSAYRKALKVDPTDALALKGLAWLVATCPDPKLRNGRLAIELATRACELVEWGDTSYMDTLAAAYAEAGDFESAVCLQRETVASLVPGEANQTAFRERLQLYENKKPYRDYRRNGP